jgi:hypothetical protein
MPIDNTFFAAVAANILGLAPEVKIQGTTGEMNVVQEVLESSRSVYSLLKEDSTSAELAEALELKEKRAKKFKDTFNQQWPF